MKIVTVYYLVKKKSNGKYIHHIIEAIGLQKFLYLGWKVLDKVIYEFNSEDGHNSKIIVKAKRNIEEIKQKYPQDKE